MSNQPKGAMGSPYIGSENEESVGKMLEDAYDRLHTNSWDGGKEAEAKRIAKLNAETEKKLQKKEQVPEEIEVPSDAECGSAPIIESGNKFKPEVKKEMLQLVLENDLVVDEVTDEKIVFSDKDSHQFVILPYKE